MLLYQNANPMPISILSGEFPGLVMLFRVPVDRLHRLGFGLPGLRVAAQNPVAGLNLLNGLLAAVGHPHRRPRHEAAPVILRV